MYNVGFYGGKFLPLHKGHMNCILRAASECKKLYVVCMYNGEQELDILNNQTINFDKKYLTPHIRELVLRREFRDFPNIEVVMYDDLQAVERAKRENKALWECECEDMIELMGEFDVAYSSEESYYEAFKESYPFAEAKMFDLDRNDVPVSATMIRELPFYEAYYLLPRGYQRLLNKSVLITGTESCGKSTLTRMLAKFFNTSYTEEYGRIFCEKHNMSNPGIEWYEQFLHGQYMEDIKAKDTANMVYFCDTDSVVTNLYSQLYEDVDMKMARDIAAQKEWDLILFVEPTNQWVADGLRQSGSEEERQRLNGILRDMYKDCGQNVKILNGTYEENYMNAVQYVKDMLEV